MLSSKSTANSTIFQWPSEHKDEQLYMLTKKLMFNVSVGDEDIVFFHTHLGADSRILQLLENAG